MPRVPRPTASCNDMILNRAKTGRQKRAASATKLNLPIYSGPIDDAAMEIHSGEIVVRMPDGSVTSTLNGCPQALSDGKLQAYQILGVAIGTSTPTPSTRDPHTMANVAVAGSVPVRNVGSTTFFGGDEVFAVYPTNDPNMKTGRNKNASQMNLFSLVKGTSRKPIFDAIIYNESVRKFFEENYHKMLAMTEEMETYDDALDQLVAKTDKSKIIQTPRVKLLLKQLKRMIEYLRGILTMARGHRLGIVEENKQVMPGEEMSVYITPPH